jgi:hypothetical protein
MLMHHVTVIVVASMTLLMTNGFRYWIPYFFGIMEIISIPLAIMNTFKTTQMGREATYDVSRNSRCLFSIVPVHWFGCVTPRHLSA